MVAAKNCPRKGSIQHRHGVRGFVVSLTHVATINEPRGELAPLSRHTHNMEGGPLNVMEVVGSSRNQYEWRVSRHKIGSWAMVFPGFLPFLAMPRGG